VRCLRRVLADASSQRGLWIPGEQHGDGGLPILARTMHETGHRWEQPSLRINKKEVELHERIKKFLSFRTLQARIDSES
jgi:hypothetical protein